MSSDEFQGGGGESFASMFEKGDVATPQRKKRLRMGERVNAKVVQVGKESVFVELEGGQQAYFDAAELRDEEGNVSVKEGATVSAHVVELEGTQGIVRLGKSMGRPNDVTALLQAKEARLGVDGKVTGVNKGGLDVDFGGTRAFCPMSQIDKGFTEDPKSLLGQTLRFLVTDVRDGGKNVVVSRKAFQQQEAQLSASRAMSEIVAGAVLRGTVTSVRDFGAFVDLGGIEGLVPRSEIAHDRSVSVAESLKAGDSVEVSVRDVKELPPGKPGSPTHKITLSLKALMADPWSELDIREGKVLEGTVVRKAEFGRFVRIAPGVDGLLHVSELGKADTAEEGTSLRVVVKKIDRDAKKVSLGLAPDGVAPGAQVNLTTNRVKVGAIVTGTVDRIETYGVFLQIEGTRGKEGRGLVPSAELGVPRGTDLRKTFPEGTKLTAKVLETGDGRIRLSVKGAKEAEERADFEQAKGKQGPTSLGTFADLLKGKKL
ncbi:MAG: S1 RNA-binding domain-containing protein [Polyangiaceae bacterium]